MFFSFQMPRYRKRTTDKASWIAEMLQTAVQRCRQGVSIHKVAKETGIPCSTLQKKTKLNEADLRSPKLGRNAIFSTEQENTLTDSFKFKYHVSRANHATT